MLYAPKYDEITLRSDKEILCRVETPEGEIVEDKYCVYADVICDFWWEERHPDGLGYYEQCSDYTEPNIEDFYIDPDWGKLIEILEPEKICLVD